MQFKVILEIKDANGYVVGSTDDTFDATDADNAERTAIAAWNNVNPACTYRALLTTQVADRTKVGRGNPVVAATEVDGWVVREFADGMYDAIERHPGVGMSPGFDSFDEARGYVNGVHARARFDGEAI